MTTQRVSKTEEREKRYLISNNENKDEDLIAKSPIVEKKKKTIVVVKTPVVKTMGDSIREQAKAIRKEEGILSEDEEDSDKEIDISSGINEISNKNFKIKNQQFLLTYKTHLDKDYMKEFIKDIVEEQGSELVEFYICHETGDTTNNYNHSHIYMKAIPAILSYEVTIFDVPEDDSEDSRMLHPNIKTVRKGLANEWNTKYYLTKEDKSEDLKELSELCQKMAAKGKFNLGGGKSAEKGKPLAERVWACGSLREALKTICSDPGWASGIRTIWEEKELKERPKIPFRKACDWSWQMYLRDKLLLPEWDHRLLHWIVGKLGAEGKSSFANYFTNNYGGIYLSSCSGASNIATVLSEHINAGGSCKYIFIDLPRAAKIHKMWDTLECLLNGKITVMKYKGKSIDLGKPRVIVFSNWHPPFDVESIKESMECNRKGKQNPDLYNPETKTYAKDSVAIGQDDTLSHDRWEIGDIFSSIDEKGEPDRILTWRKNPFRKEWVKPTRFNHLPEDFY